MLYVIGYNGNGELGIGHRNNVHELTNWNNIYSHLTIENINNGHEHTIFTTTNNEYFVCGYNIHGECGIITDTNCILKCKNNEYFIENNMKIKQIFTSVCGNHSTFWITNSNKLFVNGNNKNNKLGLGKHNHINIPTQINTLQNIINIKGGYSHTIAICGSTLNKSIILFIITYWYSHKYIPIDIISMITKYYYIPNTIHSICSNVHYGQDGHGTDITLNRGQWNIISSLNDKYIVKISCGWHFTLFLSNTGIIYSCGINSHGQLGLGTDETFMDNIPQQIDYFIKEEIIIIEIQSGSNHSLCIDNNYKIYSWGLNRYGECGNGTKIYINTPQIIKQLLEYNIKIIKCGYSHSYVKTNTHKHYLFGSNHHNECSLQNIAEKMLLLPLKINQIFSQITNGKIIKNVFLGCRNTFIISE